VNVWQNYYHYYMANSRSIIGFFRRGKPTYGGYIRFLLVDENDIINALSGIEGGGIDQILARTRDLRSRNMSFDLAASASVTGSAGARAGSNRSAEYEEEVVRKRTVHSAAVALLNKLEEKRRIKAIGRGYSSSVYDELRENMLVRVEAEIRLHPLHRFVKVSRRWAQFGELLGRGEEDAGGFKEYADEIENLFQLASQEEKFFVYAETDVHFQGYRLILPVKVSELTVPTDEFAGRAHFIAQVDHIVDEGDEIFVANIISGEDLVPPERDLMLKRIPILANLLEKWKIDIPLDEEDVKLHKPTVVLRPICVFR
jgi:hypothetical protein